MNYQETLAYLDQLGHEVLNADYRLGRIERLLDELGQPQRAYPSLIIAGTNGKGSVAAMLDSIVRHAGLRSGLYTSPHLVSVCERIKVDGQDIAPEAFADHATMVREASRRLLARGDIASLPTFFEQVTAIGFSYFRQQHIDLAVLEVGLGGRLDATNMAPSFLAVLTPIDFDHEEILGSTLQQIAREKAAVIKPGATAVIAPQRPEAAQVIEHRCREHRATPRFILSDPTQVWIEGQEREGRLTFSYRSRRRVYRRIRLALPGYHQVENAVLAIEAAEVLEQAGYPVSTRAIIEGLQTVVWPGRLEWLDDVAEPEPRPAKWPSPLDSPASPPPRPPILLDGAHNPAGTRALRQYLDEFGRQPLTLVFGAMRDKRIEDMAAILFPIASQVILTRVRDERAADLERLHHVAAAYESVHLAQTVEVALRRALALTPPEGMICVTGSLYLVGAVKEIWPTLSLQVGKRIEG